MTKLCLLTFLCFIIGFNIQAQDQLIKSGEEWLYYEDGALSNNWFTDLDNNSNWKSGITPIGYGDRKVVTHISFGPNKENKHIIKYFKKTITLKEVSGYLAYGFQFKRDDGIAIYLNGEEVFRDNLPIGTITNKTLAINLIDSDKESEILFTVLDTKEFKKGKNTIAISVHQASETSSDCILDFEMFGYKNPRTLSKIFNNKSQKNNELEAQIKNLTQNLSLDKSALMLDLQKSRAENLSFILIIVGSLLIIAIGAIIVLLLSSRKRGLKLNADVDRLKEQILDKEKSLLLLTTKLLHNKQYFKEIKADIKGLKNVNDSVIKDISYQIDLALDSDKEWGNLQNHFEAIYTGFYDTLLKKHPSLTEVELRHCMFIKLHMQTKEIARVLLIDPRSVQTARYRIKKKMNLSEDVDLRTYLLEITL
ncbi:MAG: hypothetical protein JXR05_14320 [Flavobacteriaceae bacterium]